MGFLKPNLKVNKTLVSYLLSKHVTFETNILNFFSFMKKVQFYLSKQQRKKSHLHTQKKKLKLVLYVYLTHFKILRTEARMQGEDGVGEKGPRRKTVRQLLVWCGQSNRNPGRYKNQ